MKRLTIVLPAIAMLAACNSKPTVYLENASIDEVEAAGTQNAGKTEPGKWETSIAILSIEGQDLPPDKVAAMKQRMSRKVEACITPEEADKPRLDMLGIAKDCTFETFKITGGTFNGVLVCKNSPAMPYGMRSTMSGNFASTSYDVTSATTMHMPPIPARPAGGDITTTTQVTAKRIGACDAPKAAG